MTTACTIVTSATGSRCGADAVHTFVGTDGVTVFGICADHVTDADIRITNRAKTGCDHQVGDWVKVHRYGKDYDARVTRVGRGGAAWATFRYDNGADRTVRVGS